MSIETKYIHKGYLELLCDNLKDIKVLQYIQAYGIDGQKFTIGTTAFVKEDGSVWMVNRNGQWERF